MKTSISTFAAGLAAATAMLAISTVGHASIIPALTSVTPDGTNFQWLYNGYLSGDQGLTAAGPHPSELVILDFAGYVPGSITNGGYATVSAFVELVTPGIILAPGVTDNPTVENLVFRYIGPDYQVSGGPYTITNFSGIGADSIYSRLVLGAFSAVAVKNVGPPPGGAGTTAYNTGSANVPGPGVPEPASWALMLIGLGGIGWVARRRTQAATAG